MEQRKSYLESLPVEILQDVGSFLDLADVASLRLSSHTIERALLRQFINDVVHTRQAIMPSDDGLQSLEELSNDPLKYTGLKHIILATNMALFAFEKMTSVPAGQQIVPLGKHSSSTYPGWNWRLTDDSAHDHGINGKDRPQLARIFRNRPNLETVQIRNWIGAGKTTDLCATEYAGRHLNHRWCETGRDAFQLDDTGALADANARPRSLEAVLVNWQSLRDPAFYIPESLHSGLVPVLSNLTKLDLSLSLGPGEKLEYPWLVAGPATDPCRDPCHLRRFLSLTTNVEELRLRFGGTFERAIANSILEWLAQDPAKYTFGPDAAEAGSALPRLRRLYLSSTTIPLYSPFGTSCETYYNLLLAFIHKFRRSLTAIHLGWIFFAVYQTTHDNQTNVWKLFLHSIADMEDLQLQEWSVVDPFQEIAGPQRFRDILFSATRGDRLAAYKGDDAHGTLRSTADNMRILLDYGEQSLNDDSIHCTQLNRPEGEKEDEDDDDDEAWLGGGESDRGSDYDHRASEWMCEWVDP